MLMIEFVSNISDFWSHELDEYNYARAVAFSDMRNGKDWHNNFKVGHLLQSFDNELPDFYTKFVSDLKLDNSTSVVSWICIQPGQIIAPHYDTFYQLLKNNNQGSIDQCLRYIIFLKNYQLGQIVDFAKTTIKNWKQGDVWVFDHTEKHWAANGSNVNFYSCQVNTINSKENIK